MNQVREEEGGPTPPFGRMDSLRQKFRRLGSSGSGKIDSDTATPQTTTQQKQSAAVDISDLLDEVDQGGAAILLRRPDHISITGRSILSAFQYTMNTNGAITINSTSALGVMNSSALKEDSKHLITFFDVNDTLEYACGLDCRKGSTVALQLGSIIDEIDNTAKDITTELHRKIEESITNSDKEELDKTVCISTTKDLKDPIRLCQAIVLLSKEEETVPADYDIGITFTERKDRIVVESISPGGWFSSKGCSIREGDIVVGINEYILCGMSPEDVSGIIKDIISSPESTQLSITAIATYLTRWDKIRRSAVAAGGGTLVASGTILMATPLHPVGHAMALGGVGLLSTEFEAPKKVLESTKERLANMRQSFQQRRESSSSLPAAENAAQDDLQTK